MPVTRERNSGNVRKALRGEPRVKAAYKTPRLAVYGDVAKLTAGVGGSNFDPGHSTPDKNGKG